MRLEEAWGEHRLPRSIVQHGADASAAMAAGWVGLRLTTIPPVLTRVEMNNAFVSSQSMHLLEQSERLDLPSEEEILKVIRLQEQGKIARSGNRAISTKRDLRGRWKELRAVQIYIQARVGQRNAAPAQLVQDQLELENSRAANNLIERARQHEYLARSQKKDDLAILPGAYRDASDLRSLVSQSREFD